jgi:predicted peptidase
MSYGLPAVLQLNEQPENFEFVVVSPQASPGSAWWHNDQLLVLNALLEEVLETYPIDPARVYLTGLSMGGYGSWYLATRYPDRFAAMISISGSGYRTTALPAADVVCKLNALPIWAIHGAEDQISAVGINERVVSSYQQRCGQEVRWTLYPDSGHFETYERAYRDPELYAWLLAQSRTTESATESTP